MFKRLIARLLGGKLLERVEAEEAYEHEFGKPPMRGMTIKLIKRRTEQAKEERERNDRPIRQRYAGQQLVQDDPILNPASPLNPIYHQPVTSSRSHSSCDDNSSRHHGGHDSHHSSGSYDSGSSDSGSSSSGSCD